jgi:hypothetical protein
MTTSSDTLPSPAASICDLAYLLRAAGVPPAQAVPALVTLNLLLGSPWPNIMDVVRHVVGWESFHALDGWAQRNKICPKCGGLAIEGDEMDLAAGLMINPPLL